MYVNELSTRNRYSWHMYKESWQERKDEKKSLVVDSGLGVGGHSVYTVTGGVHNLIEIQKPILGNSRISVISPKNRYTTVQCTGRSSER